MPFWGGREDPKSAVITAQLMRCSGGGLKSWLKQDGEKAR